ncbi:U1 snRNP protein [Saxophila tyrrhenica]|uniref:U1 snRNP protein n=1 Tax=Saxophila tyrrhenica TaxID=1690608 RepID=A0AAV9P6Q1_9PEZI|nr:U1 snRNP protein [Saxophila tyrrhenica]
MSAWKSAKAPDGRTYYFKSGTNETTWSKPADFDDAAPPATPATPGAAEGAWAEAKTAEGKVYYWNTVTKATSWTMPEGFKQQQNARPAAPAFVAGGAQNFGGDVTDRRMERRSDRDMGLPQRPNFEGGRGGGMPWEQRQDNAGFRGPMPVKTDEPEYATFEEAEQAFFALLRKHKISPDTEWEDALRAVIKEREFRALKDARERKTAFFKYCGNVRAEEKGKEQERRAKVKEDFLKMLSTHEEIKHYTRWKTARPMIEREVVFRSAGDDDTRKQLFDEYVLGLKKKHEENEIEQHRRGMKELANLLHTLVTDPYTKWHDAQEAVNQNKRFNTDEAFANITKLDVLRTFESHINALARMRNDQAQHDKNMQYRRERQARDGFKELLADLRGQGKINAGTKWTDIYPIFADDKRYTNTVGNAGSTPLEMFWDVLESEEALLRDQREEALDVLADQRYEMDISTSLDDFKKVMASDERTRGIAATQLALIYERLIAKIKRRLEKDRAHNDRSQRDAVDALRHVLKHLTPRIRTNTVYEDIVPALQGYDEYRALDEDSRRAAFDKFIRRLREKEDELERDRARRDRDRNGSRRDRDRRHRSRSPEVDAYEADRRKAQAVRESQYRKTSFGLTPPPRSERRDDRDDRYRGGRHDERYERERRERELERERSYVSRADPRDRGRALDYGDDDAVGSRPSSGGKRKVSGSDVGGKRDAKRARRGTRSPEPAEPASEPPALQSGSEEGEIEEA